MSERITITVEKDALLTVLGSAERRHYQWDAVSNGTDPSDVVVFYQRWTRAEAESIARDTINAIEMVRKSM